jgi:hypothetical protein
MTNDDVFSWFMVAVTNFLLTVFFNLLPMTNLLVNKLSKITNYNIKVFFFHNQFFHVVVNIIFLFLCIILSLINRITFYINNEIVCEFYDYPIKNCDFTSIGCLLGFMGNIQCNYTNIICEPENNIFFKNCSGVISVIDKK